MKWMDIHEKIEKVSKTFPKGYGKDTVELLEFESALCKVLAEKMRNTPWMQRNTGAFETTATVNDILTPDDIRDAFEKAKELSGAVIYA